MAESRPFQTWYLLICRECAGDVEMPFLSAEERGKWAAAHTRGTGHQSWEVYDIQEVIE